MVSNGSKNSQEKIDTLPLLLIVLAPSVRLMIPSANSLVLYVLIPLLFIWSYVKYRRLTKGRCVVYYWSLMAWLAVTVITSTDVLCSITYMKQLLGGFLASVIMYLMASAKLKNGILISIGYVFLLITTIWYLWKAGLLINLDINSERLDDEFVNANDLAYLLFYAASSFYLFFRYFHVNKIFSLFLFVFLIGVSIWLSLITASRQILLVVIPYILLCIVFQLLEEKKIHIGKALLVTLVGVGLLVAILPSFQTMFTGSLIEARMDSDVKEDARAILIEEAIKVGLDHPVFGVGPGNMIHFSKLNAFSHTSYTELFATSGFPALIIYTIMIVSMAVINRRRYKRTHKRIFMFLYLTSIIWILYNFLYVFYSSLWLISFYFLMMGISESLYRNLCCEGLIVVNKVECL